MLNWVLIMIFIHFGTSLVDYRINFSNAYLEKKTIFSNAEANKINWHSIFWNMILNALYYRKFIFAYNPCFNFKLCSILIGYFKLFNWIIAWVISVLDKEKNISFLSCILIDYSYPTESKLCVLLTMGASFCISCVILWLWTNGFLKWFWWLWTVGVL